MKYHVDAGGGSCEVELLASGLRLNGAEREAGFAWLGEGEAQLTLDGANHRVFTRRTARGWRLTVRGRTFDVTVEDERTRTLRELADRSAGSRGPRELRAPMPGLVTRVLAETGQRVNAGDGLVVIEAMKMENELRAGEPGTVAGVAVKSGDVVDRDQVLVTLEGETS
ncbi:acetyl-CoA carboxylase biotin carboxyl carrier protein subunit [Candidatus Palauibacter sp.]|uniref:acetyl-CoA carboxylase biotin carboxyl carrier protein subunit n=1 Tax=Candidatus Palauibacter sp. TaxID=3101350 RepID=UPI003B51895F